ncbi:MAG: 16S rRNA (guanine(527)-N(7))-methyltransferase RsmG [Ardenticatenaceae bacterium]|nr:16S rRNA (guanine(527)-N(7))-methyltransferase RsmG [Ardenticatenaceae bacterium]MCB9444922.1 16S rRNA (guanine(527)-N(7))-methyltransferase RsmG [Ardenticatenaceae bacterium]
MLAEFVRETAVFNITLSPEQINQFERYQTLLLDWNQRMNLTAIREPRQIQQRHFLDALTCSLVTGDLNGRSLIDVGTGAGFPGLPLKILFPDMRLTLVESVVKKTHFLEVVVAELGLRDVVIVPERAELLGQDVAHRAQYDWAVARAVAELRILVEYLLPLCRLGGFVLAQKGAGAAEEVAAAGRAMVELGGTVRPLFPVNLPQRKETHYLVVVEKTAVTPDTYPRRIGVPAKKPL